MAGSEVRIHVDIEPWAIMVHVYLNGVDISRWCKGADDERGTVIVARDVHMLGLPERLIGPERTVTTVLGEPHEEEWEVVVNGVLEIRGVKKARESFLASERQRKVERARVTLP